MTREEMKTVLDSMELIERDIMRPLTSDEEELIIAEDWKSLIFGKLGFTDEDYKTFRRIQALISSFCTENEERYEEEIRKDNGSAKFVLQSIVNDLQAREEELRKEQAVIGKPEDLGTHCTITTPATNVDWMQSFNEMFDKYSKDDAEEAIAKLKNGEHLTLDSDTINKIVEIMWNSEEDCNIQITDNTICFKK